MGNGRRFKGIIMQDNQQLETIFESMTIQEGWWDQQKAKFSGGASTIGAKLGNVAKNIVGKTAGAFDTEAGQRVLATKKNIGDIRSGARLASLMKSHTQKLTSAMQNVEKLVADLQNDGKKTLVPNSPDMQKLDSFIQDIQKFKNEITTKLTSYGNPQQAPQQNPPAPVQNQPAPQTQPQQQPPAPQTQPAQQQQPPAQQLPPMNSIQINGQFKRAGIDPNTAAKLGYTTKSINSLRKQGVPMKRVAAAIQQNVPFANL